MTLIPAEIKQYLSGGGANSDPDASLGGAISSTEITDATLNNLWDDVGPTEHLAGETEYRCFYMKNTSGADTAFNANIAILTNTTAADDTVQVGLDPAGVSGTATTIANEGAVPAGVTFSTPSVGSPLAIGDMTPGQYIAVWVKRIVSAGTTPQASNSYVLKFSCDIV